jgi:hypothetical protein
MQCDIYVWRQLQRAARLQKLIVNANSYFYSYVVVGRVSNNYVVRTSCKVRLYGTKLALWHKGI